MGIKTVYHIILYVVVLIEYLNQGISLAAKKCLNQNYTCT